MNLEISVVFTVGTCALPDVAFVSDFTIFTASKQATVLFTVSPPPVVTEPCARMSVDASAIFATGRKFKFPKVRSVGPVSI